MMFRIEEIKQDKKVIADTAIQAGTPICTFTGPVIDYRQTLKLGSKESFAFQVAAYLYILLDEPARYFNHCCEPNCGVTPQQELVALTDIAKNEELRWDYSTSMLEHHWKMKCSCNKETCRGIIGDFNRLPKVLQKKYTDMGIVQQFILDALAGGDNR